VYYGDSGATLKAFALSNAKLTGTPQSQSQTTVRDPGTASSVSANGLQIAIVWAHENSNPAVLHALDAANLGHELYNSNQAAGNRDQFGAGNKFITPTGGWPTARCSSDHRRVAVFRLVALGTPAWTRRAVSG